MGNFVVLSAIYLMTGAGCLWICESADALSIDRSHAPSVWFARGLLVLAWPIILIGLCVAAFHREPRA